MGQVFYLSIWIIYTMIKACYSLACLRFHKLTGKVNRWKFLSKHKPTKFQFHIKEKGSQMKIALIASVILLVSLVTVLGVACYAIWQAARPVISASELLLIQKCRNASSKKITGSIGAPSVKDLSDCSTTIMVSPRSGSLNSKQMEDRTSTFLPIGSLSTPGLQEHGMKLSEVAQLNTTKRELALKGLNLESVGSANTPQNIQQNQSKKPCQTCMRIKRAVLGSGA